MPAFPDDELWDRIERLERSRGRWKAVALASLAALLLLLLGGAFLVVSAQLRARAAFEAAVQARDEARLLEMQARQEAEQQRQRAEQEQRDAERGRQGAGRE
jgi:hypothetical protein